MEYVFRKAVAADICDIMTIIDEARAQMILEGKHQWDESYPTSAHIEADIRNDNAYVLLCDGRIVACGAVVYTGEPAYADIQGKWLTQQPYVVVHRLAVEMKSRKRGIGTVFIKEVERLSLAKGIHSFKADTNDDNERMQRLFKKLGFTYCGKIFFQQGYRMAYEKLLK